MKRMPKGKKKSTFLKPMLREINAHANGGFMLFVFDEDGMPMVHNHYDDATKALALQQFMSNWSTAVEALNLEATLDLMKEELENPLDDEEGDEERP
jgi:hypothetical protein